jgi:hypothetical protein
MKRLIILAAMVFAALGLASFAAATTAGPITFESSLGYTAGQNIAGQPGDADPLNNWTNAGLYDANVVATKDYTAAISYGFGDQALQISNAKTSGAFDQTYAPGVSAALSHFDASFKIGTALASYQPGSNLSVSPDDGTGNRMSYLRFEEHTNGVHVYFIDVIDKGPLGTVASFNEKDIATLSRGNVHSVAFAITFKSGSTPDQVKITIDGRLAATGTSWKNYYRFDPEQVGNHNVVPSTSTLGFIVRGAAVPSNLGNGYLVDNVTLSSS